MKICASCLYSNNHPFGLNFSSDYICTGCLTHEEKNSLDWELRFSKLENLIFKNKNSSNDYDCIVPIRGTPEYFYVLDTVVNKLGLKPLVVMYNSHFNSSVGIKNIDLIRDVFNVDFIHYTSNPDTYKKLIKETLSTLNSIRWPFLAGETQFPVKIAVEKNIPLIIWPYHQPTEQVGLHSYLEECEMTRRNRIEFELLGMEPNKFLNVGSLISRNDLEDLEYPSSTDLMFNNVRGIYLSNYIPWDSRKFSEEMIIKYRAHCSKNIRTFDTYDRIDDMTYMAIHDIIKYAKLGYSRVTDNLVREIRFKRISKNDAIGIEKYYQSHFPEKEVEIFLDWLGGMDLKGFLWYLKNLPHKVSIDLAEPILLNENQVNFINSFHSNSEDTYSNSSFITFGKGLYI